MKSKKNYKKVATIDLGSNGIRMLISNLYKIKGKYFHTKNTLHRVPIRLGQDAFTSGKISVKNEKKLLSALNAFKNLMDANEIIDYLGYATSAMRTCSNGNKILKKIKKDIGLEIKIISGKKESNVVSGNDISEHIGKSPNYCFIDVGGGSTEVIVYKDFKFFKSKSYKIGGVRLINGLVNEEVWEEFGKWLKNNAIDLRKVKLVGIGGNINKIFRKNLKINEKNVSKFLFTNDIPDPEILIRTGNTNRLSNFLLWQLAYSEIFFEKKLWPDFTSKDFKKIINKYKKIKRNFGGI